MTGKPYDDVTNTKAAAHQLAVGTSVSIIGLGHLCRPYLEGRAVIKGPMLRQDHYLVQFAGDPRIRQRVVHPDYQADPERTVEIMVDLWRAFVGTAFDDFFPDDPEH